MRRTAFFALSFLLLTAVAAFAAPSAILVDTSRSITTQRFQEAKGIVADLLPAMTAKGPVALFTFDDKAEKVVDFTQDPAALKGALDAVKQSGTYTLLYDALFTAAKDLEAQGKGGVILLVTDGRDENSAVTLEDVAARCETAGVAVVTLGMGSNVDTKALRRLATLTGGKMAGELPEAKGEAASTAVSAALGAAKAPASPAPAPPPAKAGEPPISSAPPTAPAVPAAPQPGGLPWIPILVILGIAGLVVSAILIFLILKRTKPPEERSCLKCGRELNLWESECPTCLAKSLSITNPGVDSEHGQTPVADAIPEIDPALLQKAPTSESLENTIVMDEVPVLVLKRGNNPPRMFQLPPDQLVSVGRDKVNTISIADPTLSGQHFRIVPKEGVYYLVDLKSTNGTFMNGERVTLKDIPAGAVIHAGQCDLQFRMEQRRLN
jgi:hypothetical protein